MKQEIKGPEDGKHWVLIPETQVPKGNKVLDAVWSVQCKHLIESQKIYKWKACLNVHGGQQVHGINYCGVAWPNIRFFFILAIIQQWKT